MSFLSLGIRPLWPSDFRHVSRYFRIVLLVFLCAAKLFSFLHSAQTDSLILFFVALIHTCIFFLNNVSLDLTSLRYSARSAKLLKFAVFMNKLSGSNLL